MRRLAYRELGQGLFYQRKNLRSIRQRLFMKVEFEMEETGDITIEVMDPDGNSVVGAQVATWPNEYSISGYSTVLASKRRSLDWIERSMQNKKLREVSKRDEPTRYSQVTDDEGRLPSNRSLPLAGNRWLSPTQITL